MEEGLCFYLNKVIKMFLKENSIAKFLKEQPNTKLANELRTIKALNEDELYSSMKALEKDMSTMAKIPNFYDGFNLSFE